MVLGLMTIELDIPGAMSLKDKRSVLNRIKDRVRNKFNVSIAEVEANDVWNYAVIGVAIVSNQQKFANQVLSKVTDLIDAINDCGIIDCELEFDHRN